MMLTTAAPQSSGNSCHISKLVVGKSLIVVAHRLNTIRNADQILVVANGEIVGRGIQEELLQSCPLYRKM